MWHSIKHSVGWVMSDVVAAARGRPGRRAVHVRYEAAGLTLSEAVVPWTADVIVLDVSVRLPPRARHKPDFTARVPGFDPVPADTLRKDESTHDTFRLTFRLPVPTASTNIELLWRNRLLSETAVVWLGPDDFFARLQPTLPTTTVRLADRSVAASCFVASQCRGVTASVVLRSPTPLVPVASLGMRVVFRSDRTANEQSVPVPLSSSQLAAREAVLTAALPKLSKRTGSYSATWFLGDRELLTQRVTGVSRSRFVQSLRLTDARFVLTDKQGTVRTARHAPPVGEAVQLGPCFTLASSLAGVAGLIPVQVHTQHPAGTGRAVFEQTILVTDGPTSFLPGVMDVAETVGLNGFELKHRSGTVGVLSLHPVPSAAFTAEGGFKPPPDFPWTPTAEDELTERLNRLMRDDPK